MLVLFRGFLTCSWRYLFHRVSIVVYDNKSRRQLLKRKIPEHHGSWQHMVSATDSSLSLKTKGLVNQEIIEQQGIMWLTDVFQ